MEPVDLLRAGRARIERGWIQGTFHFHAYYFEDDSHRYCMVGSLQDLTQDRQTYLKAINVLASFVPPSTLSTEGRIINYNDKLSRRKSEVLAVFDQAIAHLVKNQADLSLPNWALMRDREAAAVVHRLDVCLVPDWQQLQGPPDWKAMAAKRTVLPGEVSEEVKCLST